MFDHLDDPNPISANGDARRAVEGRRLRIMRRRRAAVAGVASLAVVVAAGGVAFGVAGNHRSGQSVRMTHQPPSASTSTTATTSTLAPSTTAVSPPVSVAATTTTAVPMPPQALVCGKLDATSGPASATATDGNLTAVLSGVQLDTSGTVPYLSNAQLTVRSGGQVVLQQAVGAPKPTSNNSDGKGPTNWTSGTSASAPVTLGPLCVARFAGSPYLAAVFNYFGQGAHCCFAISAIPLTGPEAGHQVFLELVNSTASPEVHNGNAVLISSDNRFDYAFACFACSGAPVQVYEVQSGQLVDRTRDYPDLIAADESLWWAAFSNPQNTGDGNGLLAAWVADKCMLGQKTAAFSTVDQLNQEGKLQMPTGWPSGSAYVSALRTFLAQTGYC